VNDVEAGSFFGTFTPRLDDKGRLILPAKFRPRLADGVVLTRGQDHCIFAWPPDTFNAFTERIREMPFTNKQARNFVRMLYSGAASEQPDKQGRIAIPAVLRDWAGITRECAVIGAMDRIEIWDADTWNEFEASEEEAYADMSEEVMPGIF